MKPEWATCDSVRDRLALSAYGELSFDEETRIEAHLAGCASCRAEREEVENLLSRVDCLQYQPTHAQLTACRQRLAAAIAAQPSRVCRFAWLPKVSLHWGHASATLTPVWAQVVGACALIALGFFGGQLASFRSALAAVPESGLAESSLAESSLIVPSPDPVSTRVRFVDPGNAGRIQIVYEEIRQKTLSGSPSDQAVRKLLLTAARDTSDPGIRVESLDILKSQPASDDVVQALLYAVQLDPNPAVRLKAMEGLRPFALQPPVRQALARVLLQDTNTGVRKQAIDLLVERREPAMVSLLQELLQRESNGYIRQRCQRTLRELNASVQPF